MNASRSSVHTSRREFLTLAATAAGVTAASCGSAQVVGQPATSSAGTQQLVGDATKRRILLRGGVVLTLDQKVGDFEKADVLIDGKKIVQVATNVAAGDVTKSGVKLLDFGLAKAVGPALSTDLSRVCPRPHRRRSRARSSAPFNTWHRNNWKE